MKSKDVFLSLSIFTLLLSILYFLDLVYNIENIRSNLLFFEPLCGLSLSINLLFIYFLYEKEEERIKLEEERKKISNEFREYKRKTELEKGNYGVILD